MWVLNKKYNEGSLFGKWFELSDYANYEEFLVAIKEFHKDEEDPEFMFQDYECSTFIEALGLISGYYLSKEIYNISDLIANLNYDYEVLDSILRLFWNNRFKRCYKQNKR